MALIKRLRGFLFGQNPKGSIIKNWEKEGKPSPPPHIVKQLMIKKLQKKLKYATFVETGTYLGEMIEAQKSNFERLFSIELSETLYQDALIKFASDKKITILQGDSGKVLFDLCIQITEPAIFWLDGHYSEGITAKGDKFCPIYEELSAIFQSQKLPHVLLIDDARLFIGKNDYPTISDLTDFILRNRPEASVSSENDIIFAFLN